MTAALHIWADEEVDIFAVPEDGPEEPELDTHQAEQHLAVIRELEEALAEQEAHAKAEIQRIQGWLERKREQTHQALGWREGQLRWLLRRSEQKTLKLINGTLRLRPGRASVLVTDDRAFLSWAQEHQPALLRIKREPDKKAILAHIQQDGDIPPGIDLGEPEDSFSVKTAAPWAGRPEIAPVA